LTLNSKLSSRASVFNYQAANLHTTVAFKNKTPQDSLEPLEKELNIPFPHDETTHFDVTDELKSSSPANMKTEQAFAEMILSTSAVGDGVDSVTVHMGGKVLKVAKDKGSLLGYRPINPDEAAVVVKDGSSGQNEVKKVIGESAAGTEIKEDFKVSETPTPIREQAEQKSWSDGAIEKMKKAYMKDETEEAIRKAQEKERELHHRTAV